MAPIPKKGAERLDVCKRPKAWVVFSKKPWVGRSTAYILHTAQARKPWVERSTSYILHTDPARKPWVEGSTAYIPHTAHARKLWVERSTSYTSNYEGIG